MEDRNLLPKALTIQHNGLQIKSCHRFWQRLIGLMGCKDLPFNRGIVLSPCRDVHSFFMQFSICVLHCDKAGRLVKFVPSLRPWSWSTCSNAYFVFEFKENRFHSADHAREWLEGYFRRMM